MISAQMQWLAERSSGPRLSWPGHSIQTPPFCLHPSVSSTLLPQASFTSTLLYPAPLCIQRPSILSLLLPQLFYSQRPSTLSTLLLPAHFYSGLLHFRVSIPQGSFRLYFFLIRELFANMGGGATPQRGVQCPPPWVSILAIPPYQSTQLGLGCRTGLGDNVCLAPADDFPYT